MGKNCPFFPGSVVSIHNQETKDEDEFFLKGNGSLVEMYKKMNIDNSFYQPPQLRSLQTYFSNFSKAASVILVHNTFTKQQDINYISKVTNSVISSYLFVLCPNANLYIENTLPPVEMLLKNDCNIVIGTDSLASNHQLKYFGRIKNNFKKFSRYSD